MSTTKLSAFFHTPPGLAYDSLKHTFSSYVISFIYRINWQISACEPPSEGGEDLYLTTLAEMNFLIDKCIIVAAYLQVVSSIKLSYNKTYLHPAPKLL